jgi:thiopeptide-type bacteriocin biosynthesis protein
MTVRSCWVSVYIPLKRSVHGAEGDATVHDVIAPTVRECEEQGLVKCAFFVRYFDTIPHLRLRLLPKKARDESTIVRVIQERWAVTHKSPIHSPDELLRWVPYEPELGRYGGSEGVESAERLFYASSKAAFGILTPDIGRVRSARLGRATLTMLVAFHVFWRHRQRASEFARMYGNGYAALTTSLGPTSSTTRSASKATQAPVAEDTFLTLRRIWSLLNRHSSLSPALNEYRKGLVRYRKEIQQTIRNGRLCANGKPITCWEQAAATTGASVIHMMNNRLGVTIGEESYLALVLASALDRR